MIFYCPFCGKTDFDFLEEHTTEEGFQNPDHYHCSNCDTNFTVEELFL